MILEILKCVRLPEGFRLQTSFAICNVALLVTLFGCAKGTAKETPAEKDPLIINYSVRTQWPHDTKAFTEGLVIHDGKLFEGTGRERSSWIGLVDVNTGETDKKVILEDTYFGEGITILNNKIYQLTYKTEVGFIYDLGTFRKLGEFTYEKEGWGLTHDGNNLIMSNGTDELIFLDTVTLKPVKKLKVTDDHGPVKMLNELEYVKGSIMANVWQTNTIVKISPGTGKVIGKIDLSALTRDAKMRHAHAEELNGIAYHPGTNLLLVTGKHWPLIYVIHLYQ